MKIVFIISMFFNMLLFAQSESETSFTYIKLPNKNYTLTQILDKSNQNLFSPLHPNQSKFGFTDNIFWIKVDCINSSSSDKTKVLELNHPSLDYIDIYELQDQQLVLKKELGDLRVYDKSTFMPNPNYEFVISSGKKKVFFIKIISEGTLNIGVSVQDIKAYNLYSSTQIKWLSFYFGAVFIMLMYNFLIYLVIKNKSYLYYVLFHISYTIFALGLSGISFELFWPETPVLNQYVLPMAMAMTSGFSILFTIHFLNINVISNKLYRFLYALVHLSFLVSLSPFVSSYSFAIQLSSLISFLTVMVLFILSLYLVFFKKSNNALFYLFAWSFFFIGVSIAHLSNIGIVPSTMLTSFSSQIGSFFELLLLSIGLAYYYNRLQDEHRELTYTNDKLRVLSNTDVLTGTYNRRYFFDTIKTLLLEAKEGGHDFHLLMLDLDYFKNINDTFGHDAGDKVLVAFANTCKAVLRENDTFARIGGEEFVLFLANTDKTTAISIAERINDSLKSTTFDFDPELRLTVSIGISHSTSESHKLLQEADEALYQAKDAGRGTYVYHT